MPEKGLMTQAGLKKIEQAKADGSWVSVDDVEALVILDDLAKALAQTPLAQENFGVICPTSKKGILQWIKTAKQNSTRQKRIAKTVQAAAKNSSPF